MKSLYSLQTRLKTSLVDKKLLIIFLLLDKKRPLFPRSVSGSLGDMRVVSLRSRLGVEDPQIVFLLLCCAIQLSPA